MNKTLEEIRAQIMSNEKKISYTLGRMEALKESVIRELKSDVGLIELLRNKAWKESGCKTLVIEGLEVSGAPTGWPDGIKKDEYVDEYVNAVVEKRLGKSSVQSEDNTSSGPILKSFHDSLGGEE